MLKRNILSRTLSRKNNLKTQDSEHVPGLYVFSSSKSELRHTNVSSCVKMVYPTYLSAVSHEGTILCS